MESRIEVINKSMLLGREIDVYGSVEEPLFKAKDVADWLEHSDAHKLVEVVDEDEKVRSIVPTLGGNQEVWMLTEDGLYEVLMQSRKPIARQFKKGVKQILKAIRRTGSYSAVSEIDVKMKAASWAAEFLNMNDVGRLQLAKAVLDPLGLPSPDYVSSKGVLHSASELLKRLDVGVSVLKFNQRMVEMGFLKEGTRQGTTKLHKFKVITSKGLEYGENQVSPKNQSETQPRWYDDKFGELLRVVGLA